MTAASQHLHLHPCPGRRQAMWTSGHAHATRVSVIPRGELCAEWGPAGFSTQALLTHHDPHSVPMRRRLLLSRLVPKAVRSRCFLEVTRLRGSRAGVHKPARLALDRRDTVQSRAQLGSLPSRADLHGTGHGRKSRPPRRPRRTPCHMHLSWRVTSYQCGGHLPGQRLPGPSVDHSAVLQGADI